MKIERQVVDKVTYSGKEFRRRLGIGSGAVRIVVKHPDKPSERVEAPPFLWEDDRVAVVLFNRYTKYLRRRPR